MLSRSRTLCLSFNLLLKTPRFHISVANKGELFIQQSVRKELTETNVYRIISDDFNLSPKTREASFDLLQSKLDNNSAQLLSLAVLEDLICTNKIAEINKLLNLLEKNQNLDKNIFYNIACLIANLPVNQIEQESSTETNLLIERIENLIKTNFGMDLKNLNNNQKMQLVEQLNDSLNNEKSAMGMAGSFLFLNKYDCLSSLSEDRKEDILKSILRRANLKSILFVLNELKISQSVVNEDLCLYIEKQIGVTLFQLTQTDFCLFFNVVNRFRNFREKFVNTVNSLFVDQVNSLTHEEALLYLNFLDTYQYFDQTLIGSLISRLDQQKLSDSDKHMVFRLQTQCSLPNSLDAVSIDQGTADELFALLTTLIESNKPSVFENSNPLLSNLISLYSISNRTSFLNNFRRYVDGTVKSDEQTKQTLHQFNLYLYKQVENTDQLSEEERECCLDNLRLIVDE